MLFNSYVFIFAFLPITVLGFALLGALKKSRFAILWLTLCSCVYYGYWSWKYLLLLGFSMGVNFLIGTRWLAAPSTSARKLGLAIGVTFNLALLCYFKYTNLLIDSFNTVAGSHIPLLAIILPLGISFFTFQKIAYLTDMYRGRGYSRSFLDYALFVVFFPQLIAGPIVHPREILPQFSRRRGFGVTSKNLGIGLTLFVFGLTKKVLIADSISATATRIFTAAGDGHAVGLAPAWLGALAYTLQIYFDFSGYSDMAIGLARIFGVRMPLNFNAPYQSHNIIDFWRRWHITLSRFLRDYLYISLGGNRKGKARRYANLMLTMLLGGLWHGASWTFLFWGGLHGLYLTINHAWITMRGKKVRDDLSIPTAIWTRGLTFIAVVVAWVFFRAERFNIAGRMLKGMAGLNGIAGNVDKEPLGKWLVIVALLLWVFFLPPVHRVMALARPALGVRPPLKRELSFTHWKPSVAWAILTALLFVACILHLSRASEFIYYQF